MLRTSKHFHIVFILLITILLSFAQQLPFAHAEEPEQKTQPSPPPPPEGSQQLSFEEAGRFLDSISNGTIQFMNWSSEHKEDIVYKGTGIAAFGYLANKYSNKSIQMGEQSLAEVANKLSHMSTRYSATVNKTAGSLVAQNTGESVEALFANQPVSRKAYRWLLIKGGFTALRDLVGENFFRFLGSISRIAFVTGTVSSSAAMAWIIIPAGWEHRQEFIDQLKTWADQIISVANAGEELDLAFSDPYHFEQTFKNMRPAELQKLVNSSPRFVPLIRALNNNNNAQSTEEIVNP